MRKPVRKPQNTKELTERINARLKAVKLSARKACSLAGLDDEAIRNIRRGSQPRAGVLSALAPVLQCSLAYLNLETDDVGTAEKSPTGAVNAAGLHPALQAYLTDVQERLAARHDPELLRFYLSLAYLHDEWLATGQPFSAPGFLTRAQKLIEHYDLSSPAIGPQRAGR